MVLALLSTFGNEVSIVATIFYTVLSQILTIAKLHLITSVIKQSVPY